MFIFGKGARTPKKAPGIPIGLSCSAKKGNEIKVQILFFLLNKVSPKVSRLAIGWVSQIISFGLIEATQIWKESQATYLSRRLNGQQLPNNYQVLPGLAENKVILLMVQKSGEKTSWGW